MAQLKSGAKIGFIHQAKDITDDADLVLPNNIGFWYNCSVAGSVDVEDDGGTTVAVPLAVGANFYAFQCVSIKDSASGGATLVPADTVVVHARQGDY